MGMGALADRWRRCSCISAGPVAQLRPKTSGLRAPRLVSAAAISVPSSMVPVCSIVTCSWMGTWWPSAAMARRAPMTAAFAASRSKWVSQMSRSTPPSMRPRAITSYASRSSAKGICPSDGDLVPGPIEPATNPSWPSATSRAMRADARLISWARSGIPYSPSGTAKPPKLAVSTTSAPARKCASCISAMTSGRVTARISLQPSKWGPPKSSAVNPSSWMYVPKAPS